MKLLNLIQRRYSVRSFLPTTVEKDKLESILECARLAPSACNFQPWFFYVVTSDKGRQAVLDAYPRDWITTAPLYIVLCKDKTAAWKRADDKDFGDIDAAIAAEHICLGATEVGLGTCWVCNFDLSVLTSGLNIPKEQEAIAIFPIGYINEEKSKRTEKKRKSLPDITKWI